MEIITAEQAIEAAKGLTFEKVWAALMESRLNMEESHRRMDESSRRMDERFEKRMEEYQRRMDERIEETQKRMDESQRHMDESQRWIEKTSAGLTTPLTVLRRPCFPQNCATSSMNSGMYSIRRQTTKSSIKTRLF